MTEQARLLKALQDNKDHPVNNYRLHIEWKTFLRDGISSFSHYIELLEIWKEHLPLTAEFYPGILQSAIPSSFRFYTNATVSELEEIVQGAKFKRDAGDDDIIFYKQGTMLSGSVLGPKSEQLASHASVIDNKIVSKENGRSYMENGRVREQIINPYPRFEVKSGFNYRAANTKRKQKRMLQLAETSTSIMQELIRKRKKAVFETRYYTKSNFAVANFEDLKR